MRNKKERIFVKQNGLLCALKGRGRPHVTPHTQEAALMRLNVASLRRMVKGKLHVQFVRQDLTSYSGLELLRRYLRQLDLPRRLRAACAATGGDYGGGRLALLILALFYVGARRLEHLRYLGGDPLIARFCGLARVPTGRTVGTWLRQFTQTTLAPLVQLNHDLVTEAIKRLALPRLTIDVDGTVVRTGATVGWAFRGFNPHHRKDPSYYPLLAHVAQTGHILRVKNRPGNVHDSKQAVPFLRDVIDGLRTAFGRRLPLEFRMDAAFFQRDVLRLLGARGCAYAIKVGYWHWLPLKQLAADRQRWLPVAPTVTGFFHDLDIPQWQLPLRVMIYRKHVAHESPKNFHPPPPAAPNPRPRKRTYASLIGSMRPLRFLLAARAGRLARIGGRHV